MTKDKKDDNERKKERAGRRLTRLWITFGPILPKSLLQNLSVLKVLR